MLHPEDPLNERTLPRRFPDKPGEIIYAAPKADLPIEKPGQTGENAGGVEWNGQERSGWWKRFSRAGDHFSSGMLCR